MDLTSFTPEELERLCYLRAIEWLAWPAFVSQPLLPILYIYYPVYVVLVVVVALGFLWLSVRYTAASLQLAYLGCYWVRLKWLTIPIGSFVLASQHRYVAVVIALSTPWLVGLLSPFPGKVAIVESRFMSIADPFGLRTQQW